MESLLKGRYMISLQYSRVVVCIIYSFIFAEYRKQSERLSLQSWQDCSLLCLCTASMLRDRAPGKVLACIQLCSCHAIFRARGGGKWMRIMKEGSLLRQTSTPRSAIKLRSFYIYLGFLMLSRFLPFEAPSVPSHHPKDLLQNLRKTR